MRSEDGEAVAVGAEGQDVCPGVAGVGGEMGGVGGLDGAVEDVDDVVVLLQADVKVESVALRPKMVDTW